MPLIRTFPRALLEAAAPLTNGWELSHLPLTDDDHLDHTRITLAELVNELEAHPDDPTALPAAANLGGTPIEARGALALIVAAMSWSVASVLTRKLSLPPSKVMSSGAQMLAGGIFLALAAAIFGEFREFHPGQFRELHGWLCST